MSEPGGWLIEVSTEPNFIGMDNVGVLKPFSIAIQDDETLHSANPAMVEGGILQATVTVEDQREEKARDIAIAAFYRALETAGYDTQKPGWRLNVRTLGPLPDEPG
jgi:hypothetical protein